MLKPYLFHRKVARIIAALAQTLQIPQPQALVLFYTSRTSAKLHNPATALYLMSDLYILEDLINEIPINPKTNKPQ